MVRFSAAIRRGLIEATARAADMSASPCFPRRFAAASLKLEHGVYARLLDLCFPRRFAAASLKPGDLRKADMLASLFSAAIRRGLIEALSRAVAPLPAVAGFPRRFAAASLKQPDGGEHGAVLAVFRGDSPRPH